MIQTSYLRDEELEQLGLKSCGLNVRISRNACLYDSANLSIGSNSRIDDFCILSGNITIGSYVHIAAYCGLWGKKGIVMEDFAGLSAQVLLYSSSDDYTGICLTNPTIPLEFASEYGGPVILRKHVIVGAGSLILPNIEIGEGAAVGAMSMVTRNLKPWWIYAGIPVKQIKTRQKKLIEIERKLKDSLKFKC